jgi:hypothetical protein
MELRAFEVTCLIELTSKHYVRNRVTKTLRHPY